MGKKTVKKNDVARKASVEIGEQEDKRPVAVRRDGAAIHVNIDGPQGPSMFGTSDANLARHLLEQTMIVFPKVINDEREADPDESLRATNHALSIFYEIKPEDPVEAMLICQLVGVHNTAMDLLQKSQAAYLSFERRQQAMNQAVKLTRTYALQMEALKKYRNGGQQTVTVQHVNVGSGGQAIVGNVQQKVGGSHEKRDG